MASPNSRYLALGALLLLGPTIAGSLSAQTVWDSAGVRIVQYAEDDRAQQSWVIDREPILSLGAADAEGPTQFADIVNVVWLSDGSFAVGDGLSREIRIFELDGRHRETLGGPGEGPGEIPSRLMDLWRFDTTLAALDAGDRVHLVHEDGTPVRTLPRPRHDGFRLVFVSGVLGDGSTLGFAQGAGPTEPTDSYVVPALVFWIRDGSAEIVSQHPGYIAYKEAAADRPRGNVFGPQFRMGTLDDGYCVGFSDAFAFHCFDPQGTQRLSIRVEGRVGANVTRQDRAAFLSELALADGIPEDSPELARIERDLRFAERAPLFEELLGAENGELWVGPFSPAAYTPLGTMNPSPPTPSTWTVFSSDGGWLSDVTLPARFRLMAVRDDLVVGVRRDEWDVEHVEVYRLRGRE